MNLINAHGSIRGGADVRRRRAVAKILSMLYGVYSKLYMLSVHYIRCMYTHAIHSISDSTYVIGVYTYIYIHILHSRFSIFYNLCIYIYIWHELCICMCCIWLYIIYNMYVFIYDTHYLFIVSTYIYSYIYIYRYILYTLCTIYICIL